MVRVAVSGAGRWVVVRPTLICLHVQLGAVGVGVRGHAVLDVQLGAVGLEVERGVGGGVGCDAVLHVQLGRSRVLYVELRGARVTQRTAVATPTNHVCNDTSTRHQHDTNTSQLIHPDGCHSHQPRLSHTPTPHNTTHVPGLLRVQPVWLCAPPPPPECSPLLAASLGVASCPPVSVPRSRLMNIAAFLLRSACSCLSLPACASLPRAAPVSRSRRRCSTATGRARATAGRLRATQALQATTVTSDNRIYITSLHREPQRCHSQCPTPLKAEHKQKRSLLGADSQPANSWLQTLFLLQLFCGQLWSVRSPHSLGG